jgi:hypothetical protein
MNAGLQEPAILWNTKQYQEKFVRIPFGMKGSVERVTRPPSEHELTLNQTTLAIHFSFEFLHPLSSRDLSMTKYSRSNVYGVRLTIQR